MTLDATANKIIAVFAGKETEQNWEKVDTLYKEFAVQIAGHDVEEIVQAVRKFKDVLQDTVRRVETAVALMSDRSPPSGPDWH